MDPHDVFRGGFEDAHSDHSCLPVFARSEPALGQGVAVRLQLVRAYVPHRATDGVAVGTRVESREDGATYTGTLFTDVIGQGRVVALFDARRLGVSIDVARDWFVNVGRRAELIRVPEEAFGSWIAVLCRDESTWAVERICTLPGDALPASHEDYLLVRATWLRDAQSQLASVTDGDARTQLAGVRQAMTLLLERDGDDREARIARGRMNLASGELVAAEQDLRGALGNEDEVRVALVETLLAARRSSEALAEAGLLAAAHADLRGEAHEQLGDRAAAIAAFTVRIETGLLGERLEESMRARASLRAAAGDLQGALADLEACKGLIDRAEPSTPNVNHRRWKRGRRAELQRGDVLLALGKATEAIAAWRTVEGSPEASARAKQAERRRALSERARPSPSTSKDDEDDAAIEAGVRVVHPTLGEGLVLETDDDTGARRLTIEFGAMTKRLLARFVRRVD